MSYVFRICLSAEKKINLSLKLVSKMFFNECLLSETRDTAESA